MASRTRRGISSLLPESDQRKKWKTPGTPKKQCSRMQLAIEVGFTHSCKPFRPFTGSKIQLPTTKRMKMIHWGLCDAFSKAFEHGSKDLTLLAV